MSLQDGENRSHVRAGFGTQTQILIAPYRLTRLTADCTAVLVADHCRISLLPLQWL